MIKNIIKNCEGVKETSNKNDEIYIFANEIQEKLLKYFEEIK